LLTDTTMQLSQSIAIFIQPAVNRPNDRMKFKLRSNTQI
jgi:hypothetical protein